MNSVLCGRYLCQVKQGISIVFLLILIGGGFPTRELLKMQALLRHFETHQPVFHSIKPFLWTHYVSLQETDGDTEEDMQLPFKSPNSTSLGDCIPTDMVTLIKSPFKPISWPFFISYQWQEYASYSGEIWHPPCAA